MKSYNTIVVGVDFMALSDVAKAAAASLAERFGAERLHLVHVCANPPVLPVAPFAFSGDALALAWESARTLAAERLEKVEVAGFRGKVTRETRVGAPAEELAAAAEAVQAQLLVVASHDRGPLKRVILGSVASALLRTAHCPVLVVGQDRPGISPVHHVLTAVDMSAVSETVLAHAMALAARHGARLTVLSMYELPFLVPGFDELLPRYVSPAEAAQYPEKYRASLEKLVDHVRVPGVEVKIEVLSKAPPANAILDVVEIMAPDLVVVGTSGHNAWQRFFLGSTATRVVTLAHCPVVVVPREAAQIHEAKAVLIPRPA